MRFKRAISGALACVVAVTSVFAAGIFSVRADAFAGMDKKTLTVQEDAADHGVVVDYDFSKTADGYLEDKSSYHNDAVVHGQVQCNQNTGAMTLGKNAYVELPMGIWDSLTDMETFTVEARFAKSGSCGIEAWLFCLGSNISSEFPENALYFMPNGGQGMGVQVVKDSVMKTFAKPGKVWNNRYYTVNLSVDHGRINLYVNGRRVGTADGLDTGLSMEKDIVAAGTENNILGFIGRSFRKEDSDFRGSIASFKIYDRVLTANEIFDARFAEIEERKFFTRNVLGKNANKRRVAYDLKLPGRVGDFESISWQTDSAVIRPDGTVINPRDKDTEVKLTAKAMRKGGMEAVREFTVKVLKLNTGSLENTISRAAKVHQKDYTQASWRAFASALAEAKKVVAGGAGVQVGQSGVDRLQKELKTRFAALKHRPVVKVDFAPKAIKLSKVTNKKGRKLKVKFGKSLGATGYEISFATNKKFKPARKVRVKKTKATLKKLKRKTYFVRVRAYKKVNKTIYYSHYSNVKKVKVNK